MKRILNTDVKICISLKWPLKQNLQKTAGIGTFKLS